MNIDSTLLRKIIEGALLAADGPLSVAKLASLFEAPEGSEPDQDLDPEQKPAKGDILAALEEIQADCEGRGFELKEVGSGWRFQVVQETAPWVNRLWEEKPQKYSRALLETLALIAYRQPITRGDIESIRGVAVSSTIIKTLTEREWVKVVGHRDVPGRPALYATTRQFLDYFNLKSLDELPTLKEIQDFEKLESQLDFPADSDGQEANGQSTAEAQPGDEPGQVDAGSTDALTAEDAGAAEPGTDPGTQATESGDRDEESVTDGIPEADREPEPRPIEEPEAEPDSEQAAPLMEIDSETDEAAPHETGSGEEEPEAEASDSSEDGSEPAKLHE
ncbi:SMC-Scp complex subunit ScpB [Gilvimarinus sp. F26214L]|uniref:SMC-Scp complex subunit ScpB n=1 Tax=Gilvimarinus sp. DZF01 TaxID=3461371 RepID=UPI004045CCDF